MMAAIVTKQKVWIRPAWHGQHRVCRPHQCQSKFEVLVLVVVLAIVVEISVVKWTVSPECRLVLIISKTSKAGEFTSEMGRYRYHLWRVIFARPSHALPSCHFAKDVSRPKEIVVLKDPSCQVLLCACFPARKEYRSLLPFAISTSLHPVKH